MDTKVATGGRTSEEIRYLTPIIIEEKKQKFCRFSKYRIKYVDYKNPDFLVHFLNEQGKLLPRRLTGNSKKFQAKVNVAIKRARQLALLPYETDMLK